jgi:hypothetical protein
LKKEKNIKTSPKKPPNILTMSKNAKGARPIEKKPFSVLFINISVEFIFFLNENKMKTTNYFILFRI